MKTPPFTEQSFSRRSADRWWHSFTDRGIQITRLGAQTTSREEFFLQAPKERLRRKIWKKERGLALFDTKQGGTFRLLPGICTDRQRENWKMEGHLRDCVDFPVVKISDNDVCMRTGKEECRVFLLGRLVLWRILVSGSEETFPVVQADPAHCEGRPPKANVP